MSCLCGIYCWFIRAHTHKHTPWSPLLFWLFSISISIVGTYDCFCLFSLWKVFCFLQWFLCSLYSFCCLKCHVWVCTESPLSHSGLSNQEHISLRSPLLSHQWLGKNVCPSHFPLYGYQPWQLPNQLIPLASISDWLTITSFLNTLLFH